MVDSKKRAISATIPLNLFQGIEEALKTKGYSGISEFLRDAIRDKLTAIGVAIKGGDED